MIKYGILTEDSISDFGKGKAKYVEKNGFEVASEESKLELKNPIEIKFEEEQ